MRPFFVVCALLLPCSLAGAQRTPNPDPPQADQRPHPADAAPPDARPHEPDPVAFEGVQSSLNAGQKDEALAKARAIVSIYPDNVQANIMTGAILLQLARPGEAVDSFRKVVAAQPDDPHAHSLLLEAYAESGDKLHRDQERATLRRFHDDGKHPAFARTDGFMIERIPIGNESVAAIEYFSPVGKYHFSYRFDVYDTADKLIEFIALASEDEDQAFQSKKDVKAGTRRYSLDRYNAKQQALLGFIDGMPAYDDLRARVVKVLQAELDTALPADDKK